MIVKQKILKVVDIFTYILRIVFNFAIKQKPLGKSVPKIRRLSSSDFFYSLTEEKHV